MNVYISGICGVGMGPLALMAKAAGLNVCGSDSSKGAIYDELIDAGIEVSIGVQDGEFLRKRIEMGVDWFVYTSALPKEHAELALVERLGIKCTKRDEFTAYLVDKLGLKMIAVAGTHGKTTTTAMIVWTAQKLGLKASYIVGTTMGFAPSGSYHRGDKYFIYEADEYDRNFLKYHPWLAVIPSVSYDHPDIYKTREEYIEAFSQFERQSRKVIKYQEGRILEKMTENEEGAETEGFYKAKDFKLAGEARRIDAALAANAVFEMQQNDYNEVGMMVDYDSMALIDIMNGFPGVGRRFEKIYDGVYTDYGHHPEEIVATIEMAKEQAELEGKKGVVVAYQPHQNTRQHEVRAGYKDAFVGIEKLFWLPTYLTREDENLAIITPDEFIKELSNGEIAEVADANDELSVKLHDYQKAGYLVLMMTAGPADSWLRSIFSGDNA